MGDEPSYEDKVLRFVERLAMVFTESGMPRMPARVFAYVLAADDERHTAGELADGLHVSPAAISTAVRYLVQAGLLGRERDPGTRRDVYRIYDDDIWSRIFLPRVELLDRWVAAAADGAQSLGGDRPGGRRLEETREFFAFLRADLPQTMQRWQEHRRAR